MLRVVSVVYVNYEIYENNVNYVFYVSLTYRQGYYSFFLKPRFAEESVYLCCFGYVTEFVYFAVGVASFEYYQSVGYGVAVAVVYIFADEFFKVGQWHYGA